MNRDLVPADNHFSNALFQRLVREQPEGIYSLAGCAKDGSEGPPPKTPPPPPPGSGDFRDLVERVMGEVLRGKLLVQVRPGAGILGHQRSPLEFMRAESALQAQQQQRIFMVTFRDRSMTEDDQSMPELILAHVMHLRRLSDEGRLEASASYASGQQGMQIILAESKAEVEQFVKADPLVERGYYRGFDIEEVLQSPFGDC